MQKNKIINFIRNNYRDNTDYGFACLGFKIGRKFMHKSICTYQDIIEFINKETNNHFKGKDFGDFKIIIKQIYKSTSYIMDIN